MLNIVAALCVNVFVIKKIFALHKRCQMLSGKAAVDARFYSSRTKLND